MAQTKKDDVRGAILAAAFAKFSAKGYSVTTIPAIAAAAWKFDGQRLPLFPVQARHPLHALRALAGGAARSPGARLEAIADPRRRLERLLVALRREPPSDTYGFAKSILTSVVDECPGLRLLPAPERALPAPCGALAGRCARTLGAGEPTAAAWSSWPSTGSR